MFKLGKIVVTPAALAACISAQIDLLELMVKYRSGNWGEVCVEDAKANTDAVIYDGRILAVYFAGTEKLYVITEWDRSVTTILLASEY